MDKIYSRKRINIPKIKHFYINKKIGKKITFVLIIIIAIFTVYRVTKSLDPIFEGLCKSKAISFATDIINTKSTQVLEKYEYNKLLEIVKKDEDGTKILQTDVTKINEIASDIAIEVTKAFKESYGQKISIPIGAMLGNKYLSGFGPKMDIKVMLEGTVLTELKTEFESKGINQTIYRIYLVLSCDVDILTPYKKMNEKIENQVLLVETVIVGDIPITYYNLEGIDKENTIDIIE